MLLYSYSHFNDSTHFIIENYDNTLEIVEKQHDTFFDGQQEKPYFYFQNRYLKYLITDDAAIAVHY